ncbi:hypothetical protein P355_0637 [Burkholderia cenocepacia KC-01]|nr:hypothetical protein P355_0637 [Burkholderia cenocepacia KC-01]
MSFKGCRLTVDHESCVALLDSIHTVLCAAHDIESTRNSLSFNDVGVTTG